LRNVLVVGDLHLPFEKKGYLEFCKRIHKECKCTEVVMIGDLVDNHAISYHEHDPDGWSPVEEMAEADKKLKKWFKAFPKVKLCRGNHDVLVDRKGKTVGLPQRCFAAFRDIWNLPEEWVDDFQFIIGGVLYTHGTRCGKNAHLATAQDNAMSTVIGHSHAYAGVQYWANERDLMFGVNCGCGIDRHSYAMSYGKKFPSKPIISCAVISYSRHGINPTIFTMPIGGK
jgi:hypothetical protein